MREVLQISDRITILRAGETITTLNREETNGQELANLMVGRELVPSVYEKVDKEAEEVLSLSHVSYHKNNKHNGLNDVSLFVKKGEILGIAGVDGNGQSQLAQIATGVIEPEEGEVTLHGSKVSKFTPKAFIDANVSHIPEDRNKMGLVGNMSVAENLILKMTEDPKFSKGKGFFMNHKKIHKYAEEMKVENDIRCASIKQDARSLSGGNQQKIILSREINSNPDLLVAVHPTRGLDIGATSFVHDSMIKARDNGCGILLISADLDEILKVSDRIIVMFEGQIMGVYSGKKPPLKKISLAMAGKEVQ